MAKTVKSRSSIWQRAPKALVGAVGGAAVGGLAIISDFEVAIMLLGVLTVLAAYVYFLKNQSKFGFRWSQQAFSPAAIVGVLVLGVAAVGGVKYLGTSMAWHPKGVIKKSVQNVTTGSGVFDAEYGGATTTAKPGDVLKYTVVITNVAPPASKQYNDMAFTVMTDTLPDGVVLVADPTKRTITENIGLILPGKSASKTYDVKVTSSTNNALLENKACFTADSVVKDNPQKGCDLAVVKVNIPPTPPPVTPPPTTPPPTTPPPTTPPPTTPPPTTPPPTTPPPTTPPPTTPPPVTPPAETPPPTTPPPTPTPQPTPPAIVTLPAKLPNVGASSIVLVALFAALAGYVISGLYSLSANKAKK